MGGHNRWMNNPFAGDSAGPGSVPRVGTAALDPLNGLPLNWTATREPRREGVFKLLATSTGVWWGSDSCCIAGERHERLAHLPVAGGTVVPPPSVFHLPDELWNSAFSAGSVTALDHRSYSGMHVRVHVLVEHRRRSTGVRPVGRSSRTVACTTAAATGRSGCAASTDPRSAPNRRSTCTG